MHVCDDALYMYADVAHGLCGQRCAELVPVMRVLWTSLKLRKGKLSAITLRQWLSQLLSRSILLGSVGDGVAMHDIVRVRRLGL